MTLKKTLPAKPGRSEARDALVHVVKIDVHRPGDSVYVDAIARFFKDEADRLANVPLAGEEDIRVVGLSVDESQPLAPQVEAHLEAMKTEPGHALEGAEKVQP